MATNLNAPGLNRGLSLNFLWLINANYVKFTDECRIKEACFCQKTVNKLDKDGFAMMS